MEHPAIKLSNIDFTYPGEKERNLTNINLIIPINSFTIIVGPSGCGKSTLLKIASEIEKPEKGKVEIYGNSSLVFQSGAILPWRTVEQNVFLGVEHLDIPMEEKHRRVREAIKLMNIFDLDKEFPRNLSGGQRQRVGIARALATKPDILFLDEPFSALDPETTENLHSEILEIWQKTNMTILMVSHSMEEAVELGDMVVVMDKGEIKKEIPIRLERPRMEKTEAFHQISLNLRLALSKR